MRLRFNFLQHGGERLDNHTVVYVLALDLDAIERGAMPAPMIDGGALAIKPTDADDPAVGRAMEYLAGFGVKFTEVAPIASRYRARGTPPA